jgi:hypothetical protein
MAETVHWVEAAAEAMEVREAFLPEEPEDLILLSALSVPGEEAAAADV